MKLSFVIPMRNRENMKKYLEHNILEFFRNYDYEIIYVYQDDNEPFKVSLLRNIGCMNASGDFLIYRDVDVIDFQPFDIEKEYKRLGGPYRTYNARLHIKYTNGFNFEKFEDSYEVPGFGGYIVLSRKDFEDKNGFTNLCIGWGFEDMIAKHVYNMQTLNRTFGHIWHKSNDSWQDKHTIINLEICSKYLNNEIDSLLDGYRLLTYNCISKTQHDKIIEIHVNNISVCKDFAYIDLYKKHFINKIAIENFWDENISTKISILNFLGINDNYELVNYDNEKIDLLIISCFNNINPELLKCKPKITLFLTGEHPASYNTNFEYDYSISFYPNNDTNFYMPWFVIEHQDFIEPSLEEKLQLLSNKNNFCAFVVRNGGTGTDLCIQRGLLFDYITNNYKKVDSYGPYKNNVGYNLTRNLNEAKNIISKYKFYICFENRSSSNDILYITEKIINAYRYGCIPIYAGNTEIAKYFNENSFINCNGKTNEEILEIIKKIDCNDELYKNMFLTNWFLNDNLISDFKNNLKKWVQEKIICKL